MALMAFFASSLGSLSVSFLVTAWGIGAVFRVEAETFLQKSDASFKLFVLFKKLFISRLHGIIMRQMIFLCYPPPERILWIRSGDVKFFM